MLSRNVRVMSIPLVLFGASAFSDASAFFVAAAFFGAVAANPASVYGCTTARWRYSRFVIFALVFALGGMTAVLLFVLWFFA